MGSMPHLGIPLESGDRLAVVAQDGNLQALNSSQFIRSDLSEPIFT
jgi:hypothetical protein